MPTMKLKGTLPDGAVRLECFYHPLSDNDYEIFSAEAGPDCHDCVPCVILSSAGFAEIERDAARYRLLRSGNVGLDRVLDAAIDRHGEP